MQLAELKSILDTELRCERCGTVARVIDCEPAVDSEGHFGCLVADCGGLMREMMREIRAEGK